MQRTRTIVQQLARDWLNSLHRRQRRRVRLWQAMVHEPAAAACPARWPECLPPPCVVQVTKPADLRGICGHDKRVL